jgi:hypothetical protein
MRALARPGTLFALLLLLAAVARGQSGVSVELDDVVDNRVSDGMFTGTLQLRVKLTGKPLDKAAAARIVVKEARDDRGTALAEGSSGGDFTPRDYNSGTLPFSLKQPARAASSVRVKGAVELFAPGRDPNATVTVERALAKLDAPLSSKALKAAKIELTLLSRSGYAALLKSRKLDEKEIEKIRAEGKKRGVAEKEIETMIGLAKALEGLDTEPAEGAVILSGKKSDFDRIFRVEVLGANGKPIDTRGRSLSTRGPNSVMVLEPSQAPPQNASLQIFLLTDKSRQSFPFEMNVPLP